MFLLHDAWLGVDLFFVLSGFLITGILLDSRERPHYFRNFYARRFLRIFPLYYAVLAICWFFYRGVDGYFWISLVYLSNFALLFGLGIPHGPGVFWSLAIEEHFYLMWPCVVRFLSRRALAALAFLIVIGCPLLRLWGSAHGMVWERIYFYSWFRLDGLALGALLATWYRSSLNNRRRSLRLAAGLVTASVVMTIIGLPFGIMASHSVFSFTQMELVFAAFILVAVTLQGSSVTAPLRTRVAKLSGDLSYCIYLVHLPLGDGYQYVAQRMGWDLDAGLGPLGNVLVRGGFMIIASFALAWLSHHFFEGPILRLKRFFEYEYRVPSQARAASSPNA